MELQGRKAQVPECCKQTLMGYCGRRLESQTANKDGDSGEPGSYVLHVNNDPIESWTKCHLYSWQKNYLH